MSKTTSIILGDHFADFVKSEVDGGRYSTVSDVIRDGLRLLEERREEHEAKVDALRAALIEGRNSGIATDFDWDAFLAEKRTEHSG